LSILNGKLTQDNQKLAWQKINMPMNDPKLDDAMSEFKEKIINRQR